MPNQDEYKVDLEVFEGPLDLLLYLIKKEEVDVYNIPIETITTQYMDYLNVMKILDLNIAGEFIVMAATLMMIKSRMLLPVEDRGELEEEEDDPRWDLVRQLVEYKKFKDMASQLQERELYQENVFDFGGRSVVITEPEDSGLVLQDVSLFDLLAAFNDVLKNAEPESIGEIIGDHFTVADKIDHVLHVVREGKQVSFRTLFSKMASKNEVICTFLALLELLKLRHVNVIQHGHLGDIIIEKAENSDNLDINEDEVQHGEG